MNINPADWPSRDGLIVSATAPSSAGVGTRWFDTNTGILYTRIRENDNVFWVECGAPNVLGASGPTGATGATGVGAGLNYKFSTTITDADPGAGFFRFNSGTIASVTFIYIDLTDTGNVDYTSFIDSWDDSTSTSVKGYLEIKSADPTDTTRALFSVSSITTATGYRKVGVTYVSGALPSDQEACLLSFGRTGNDGISAPKAITIIAPTASEKVPMFFTTSSLTLTQIRSVIIGGTSVDFRIVYGSDLSGVSPAPTNTTTNAIVASSTTTGVITTTFSSATIPANNFVWLTTSAVSGVVNALHASLIF